MSSGLFSCAFYADALQPVHALCILCLNLMSLIHDLPELLVHFFLQLASFLVDLVQLLGLLFFNLVFLM